jgi:hypothetical protein
MYLFTRSARLGGKITDSIIWASTIAERVRQVTGLTVGLWSQTFSPSIGTVVWSTFVPDVTTLVAEFDKLAVDNGYIELADSGSQFVIPGSGSDSLQVILYGPEPDPERKVEYVSIVRTTMAVGGLAKGVALGIEIAQRAEQITGAPTSFLADTTGNYGGVAWISVFAGAAELESAQMALNTDMSFVELIDSRAPGAYSDHPGATTQLLYRRIS